MVSRRLFIARAPAIVLASSLMPFRARGQRPFAFDPALWKTDRVPNEIILKMRPGYFLESIEGILSARQVRLLQYFPLEQSYLFVTQPDEDIAVATEICESGYCEYVMPNAIHRISATPNDPLYVSGPQDHLILMNCPAAWDHLQLQGLSGVPPIIPLDTGLRITHQDIAPNLLGYHDVTGTGIDDTFGHGTRCGSLGSAATNNSAGIASVGWGGPIYEIKCGVNSFPAGNILTGLNWVASNLSPPGVITMSFTGTPGPLLYASSLQTLWNMGFFHVAASGDTGGATCDPGPTQSPYVLGVSGCELDLSRSSYANYGPSSDGIGPGALVSAPGTSPWMCDNTSDTAYTNAYLGTSHCPTMWGDAIRYIWKARPALRNFDLWDIVVNPANGTATTGFGSYPAPCLNLAALRDAAMSFTGSRFGGGSFLGRR